jgi:alkylation response protein AidB-like acyl-CoA dehydrogenase
MQTTQGWLKLAHEMGREFESRGAKHDRDDSFVSEDYATLKAHGFMSATIPEEFGGGGVSHSLMCDLLRVLGQYAGSTALAQSMHQHLVAASIWKYRHGQAGPEILKKVAAQQIVLVSTGARDWLESNGEMIKCDGGFKVSGLKRFASQSAIGDVLVTSAPYESPDEGWQVLHFPVPMNSEGVTVLNDWQTLGMRGTGSNSVKLENVFVADASIALRRPRGKFHPSFIVVSAVALPMVMSVYVGIAQRAAREAIETLKRQKNPKPHLAPAVGAMINALTTAEVALKDMIRLANNLDFKPGSQLVQDAMCRKTIVANACVEVVKQAMDIVGGQGFYREFGMERRFRDIQAAKYHLLAEPEQQRFLGEYLLSHPPSRTTVAQPAETQAQLAAA